MALLLLSLGAATFCYTQNTNLPFKSLNRQNGLLGDINAFMFKDSRGFMWVSSVQGLNRFDGRQVKNYTYDTTKPRSIWGNNIQSLFFEDKKGVDMVVAYRQKNKPIAWSENGSYALSTLRAEFLNQKLAA